MIEKEKTTELIILDAAKKIFHQKGFDGSRMQEIADMAGINKALLHYYFRSKDKLFEAVFQDAFLKFIPKVTSAFNEQLNTEQMLSLFVENYINMLIENPYLPPFILTELNRNPDKIIALLKNVGIQPNRFIGLIQNQLEKEGITNINASHLITNLISLCVFPFAARPVVQGLLLNNDPIAFENFILERKASIPQFIMKALQK